MFLSQDTVFSPQWLHSFFSFIALFSLWHWLSNSSSNRTGWLLPTLARKDPFHVVGTYTHAHVRTHNMFCKMYLYSWSQKHARAKQTYFECIHNYVQRCECNRCCQPAGGAVSYYILGHCSTCWLMLHYNHTATMKYIVVPLYKKQYLEVF